MGTPVSEGQVPQVALENWAAESNRPRCPERPEMKEFEHIYKTYNSRVYSLCLYMTGNRDEAEDLTQETFLRLLRKLDTFRGESAFYTWLRRVTVNVVLLRFQKASWRRETSLEGLTQADPTTGQSTEKELGTIDAELMGVTDRIDLERAIDQLPPGFKTVLFLHDIEGYQHTEISHQSGCSLGTSKSQLHKARLRVRELLHEAQPGPSWEETLAAEASRTHFPTVH